MRRILVLLTVVALMMVMVAMSVAPAFAIPRGWNCLDPTRQDEETHIVFTGADRNSFELDGYVCTKIPKIQQE